MNLASLMLTVPWLITREAFDAMHAIASRETTDPNELATIFHGPKSLAMRAATPHAESERMTIQDGVALIPIDGPIYRYADSFAMVSGGVSTASLAFDFQAALADPNVLAILFVIDSPGGEAEGINELADAIYAARSQKPIAAYAEGYTASAAYWIASACSTIGCDDSALIGSIGTVLEVLDPAKRARQTVEFVSKQSPKKRPNPTTESGKAVLQELTDSMTDVFVAKVARNRGVSVETVLSDFGQGGMFVGRQAIDAGLVDRLTSEEAMIVDLAMQGRGVPVAIAAVQSPQMKGIDMDKGFWANFFGGMFQASGNDTPQIAVRQLADGELLESETQPPNLAARAMITPESAADPQLAELRAQLAKMQTERITQDAQAFIQSELGAGRLLPAEQASAASLYIRAAELDSVSIQTSGPTAVDLVKAAYAARPAHRLAANLLSNTSQVLVLASSADPQQASMDEDVASIRAYGEKQNKVGKR